MEKLFSFVENVSKVAGAISIAGYLSLRAHFNFLGVSSLTPLTLERYLLETYLFVIGSLQRALPILPVLFVIGGIGWGLWRLITRRRSIQIPATFWQFLLLALLLITVVLAYYVPPATDVVVGVLKNKGYLRREWLVDLLILSVGFGLVTLNWGSEQPKQAKSEIFRRDWITNINWALLFAIALTLPLRFGTEVHGTGYPVASLKLKAGENRECGLLLYQNGESLVLWQATKGFGRVHRFETKSVDDLIVGEVRDILQMAGEAAKNETNFPDCHALGV